MLNVRLIEDNRYCCSCGCTENILELHTQLNKFKDITLVKSLTICKDCAKLLIPSIEEVLIDIEAQP